MLIFISLVWSGTISLRADRYVVEPGTPGGTDTGEFNDWGIAATQIQWAVDKAAGGETVWVSNGVYVLTNQISVTKGIVLRSTNGMNYTFVNGGYASGGPYTNRCFYIAHSDAVLDGFTITNGNAGTGGFGGGVYMTDGTVQNCLIAMNFAADGFGAGVYQYPKGTLRYCTISNHNGATYGGGVCAQGGFVQHCTIVSNQGRLGAGMNLYIATSEYCTITGNACAGSWGGGAGIYLSQNSGARSCAVVNNSSPNANFPGGGCYFAGPDNSVQDCLISGNGGPTDGGGIYIHPNAEISFLRNCTINSNTSVSGGGISSAGDNLNTIENCVISYNNASSGGGGVNLGWGRKGPMLLRNCLISSNVASVSGGGVWVGDGNTGILQNCTIVSNTTGGKGGGLFGTNANCRATNCIVYFNQAAGDGNNYTNDLGILSLTYSCATPLPAGTGNSANNPLFVNAGNGNYRLRQDSPCINAGLNESWMTNAFDLDGRARIRYGTVDMGAYETIQDGSLYGFH